MIIMNKIVFGIRREHTRGVLARMLQFVASAYLEIDEAVFTIIYPSYVENGFLPVHGE